MKGPLNSGPFFAMRNQYRKTMEMLYLACIVISGLAMVAITIMIPIGVFFRYVLNAALSWPEPASTVMMVAFSFLGGAAVYRAKVHVAVEALLNAVPAHVKTLMLWGVDACMGAMSLSGGSPSQTFSMRKSRVRKPASGIGR